MKKLYFIILFAFVGAVVNAQNCFWAKSIGGANDQSGTSIAVDDSGNVYTTGFFRGTVDFDPGAGVHNLTSGWYATFVSKLDASGNFLWAKAIGTAINNYGSSEGSSITLDGHGNVYIVGEFQDSCNFDPNSGSNILVGFVGGGNNYYSYTCKLNSAGNFVWATAVGGTGSTHAMSIAIDGFGNVYTTGMFTGITDFDPSASVNNDTSVAGGNADIFISKSDSSGNFIWAKTIGGTGSDNGWSIAVDGVGNAYTTGRFQNTVDFNPGTGVNNLVSAGGDDIYINKLDSAGNFIWAKKFGEANDEMGESISIDGSNNIYTTGFFRGTIDFNPGSGVNNLTSIADQDVFVNKFDSAGNYIWAKSFGGSGGDDGRSLKVDKTKNVYITGGYRNTVDFNPGVGTYNLTSSGDVEDFINKLDSMGNFIWAKSLGGPNVDGVSAIAVDTSQNVYTTGYFTTWADFNPYAGVDTLVAIGTNAIFISKINNPLTAHFSSITNVSCFGGHDGSATVSASGGALPYTYSWNTSPVQTAATATNLSAGIDTVTVTENFGCTYILAVTLTQPLADSAKICMVTVDSISQHNIIIWDKTSFTDVDSFIVYREITTNNYKRIGAVSFDSLSQFIDTVRTLYGSNTGNPNMGTYRYKIKTRNACGVYSAYSPYHNTIYLLNSGATFFWTQLYTIENGANPVTSYVLMRDDNSTGNWQPVGSVAGTQQTINDPLYTIYQNTASWRVQTNWGITCVPTLRTSNPNQISNNSGSSYSNILSNAPSGIKNNLIDTRVAIYPNPTNGIFIVETNSTEKQTVQVFDVNGKLVLTQTINGKANIDAGNLNEGVYNMSVIGNGGVTNKRLVIVR